MQQRSSGDVSHILFREENLSLYIRSIQWTVRSLSLPLNKDTFFYHVLRTGIEKLTKQHSRSVNCKNYSEESMVTFDCIDRIPDWNI